MAVSALSESQLETLEKCTIDANRIYKTCRAFWFEGRGRMKQEKSEADVSAFYTTLKDGNLEFVRAFPVIVEYMAMQCEYSEKAFRRFLKKTLLNPGKGMEGINERQADYAKYLYIENNRPRYDLKEAKRMWQYTFESLEANRKKFEADYERVSKQKASDDARRVSEKKQEILGMLGKGQTPTLTKYD